MKRKQRPKVAAGRRPKMTKIIFRVAGENVLKKAVGDDYKPDNKYEFEGFIDAKNSILNGVLREKIQRVHRLRIRHLK